MYDAPFDTTTVLGWILAAVVLVLLGLRALRVERRTTTITRSTGARVLDVGLDVVVALAVVALVATLVAVVVGALA